MMKHNYIFIYLLVIFLAVPMINAHFVCGEVKSESEMSPNWFSVNIYEPDDFSEYTSCEVSPAGNKYCCDSEEIEDFTIGEDIVAEVFDPVSGYIAGPVQITTTGEGYDVMPPMNLEKVIRLNNFEKFKISNNSLFEINGSFKDPYNHVEIENNGDTVLICEDCNSSGKLFNASFGMNKARIIATDEDLGRSVLENLVFAIIRWFEFDREVSCETCEDKKVKTESEVDMKININLSDEVEGLMLKEYVPVDWEIMNSSGGNIRTFSDTHNIIVWNVSGDKIDINYLVKAPKIWLFPRKYVFRTELENKLLNEDNIIVSWFFSFFSFYEDMIFSNVNKQKYSRIYPDRPLVIKPKNSDIVRLAVYPKDMITDAEFSLLKLDKDVVEGLGDLENADVIGYYKYDTNIDLDDTDKIYVEFKVEKGLFGGYNNISLYSFDENENWEEFDTEIFEEDDKYKYFKSTIGPTKGFMILGEKEGFWDFLF